MVEFARLSGALDGNEALRRRARLAALSLTVLSGDEAISVDVGERIAVHRGAAPGAAFSLVAAPESWAEFAKPVPAVGFQSLVGMQRMGHLRVEGDMVACGRNLLFLEQLFAALRPPPAPERSVDVGTPVIEPVVGRYLRLDFNGKPHRIYFEEAGEDIPRLKIDPVRLAVEVQPQIAPDHRLDNRRADVHRSFRRRRRTQRGEELLQEQQVAAIGHHVALDPEVAHPLHADQALEAYGRHRLGELR